MFIKQLSLVNFKNYEEAQFDFSSHINCFVGNNGEGKTNLLDAIHYLSFCKSFFNPIDTQNIKHEAPFFVIQGNYDLSGEELEEIYCGLKRGQKKQFKRNKKEYSRLADHIGLIPLVIISPADTDLILEGSESRRKFIDSVIAQLNKDYLDQLITYNKALSQRNALLKKFAESRSFDEESLELWDVQLVELGVQIHQSRQDFLKDFIPLFQRYYELVSGGKEQVNINYQSHLNEGDFATLLKENRGKDRAAQYSTKGIHKDDLVFTIHDFPAKKYGSQGQQKSFLIALRLAQYDFLKNHKAMKPILLLDDIHDKLDDQRVKQLMNLVSGDDFGQVFITDTSKERLEKYFVDVEAEVKMFSIQQSELSKNLESSLEE